LFYFLISYSFIPSLFLHFFSLPSFLPVRPVIAVFVTFIFHYLYRSFFALFLYFPFLHSFLCSPGSWFPTCIYLLLSLLLNILQSLLLFTLYLFFTVIFFSSLASLSCHFRMPFPWLSDVFFTMQFQPCFLLPSLHLRPLSPLIRLYVLSEVHAVSLTNPRNKQLDERCIKGKIEYRTIPDSDLPFLFRERKYFLQPETKACQLSLWSERLSEWLSELFENASMLCCSCHWTVGSDNDAGGLTWSMWLKLKLIQTARFIWQSGCLVDHTTALCAVEQAELRVAFSIYAICSSC
jgi:hypothetical protein